MKARLIFSISVFLRGNIFLIDEALNGGDAFFFRKSKKKIIELCKSGATVLYVSHNINEIKGVCDRIIILNKGKVYFDDKPSNSIKHYYKLISLLKEQEINESIYLDKTKEKPKTNEIFSITKIDVLDKIKKESFMLERIFILEFFINQI